VAVRAVRGAVQLERDEAGPMDERVSEPLTAVLQRNQLVADVPLICAQELDITRAMPRVVRILAHVETYPAKAEISHVHPGATGAPRKDIAQ
jgi:chorismate mutase